MKKMLDCLFIISLTIAMIMVGPISLPAQQDREAKLIEGAKKEKKLVFLYTIPL